MGNTQTIYLPPWEPTTEEECARAEEYTKAVRAISSVPRNFVEPDPVVHSPDFPFDWETNRAFAESAYRADARLHRLLPRLVPKRVSEEGFWRNYFSHVFAIKCRFAGRELGEPLNQLAPPPGQVESAAARLARAGSLTSQLPYPERFQLALKYVTEGPSLPVDAAPGDRILMDVLSQQATVGQCNAPRPGMWESAEAKARHEAWARLGGMSSHEAMHLYVQALQIFRKDWVLWEGLQITPDMIRRADAVTTPKRELLTSADRARSSPAVCAGAAQAAAATPGGRDGACNSLPVCASPQPAAAPSAPPPANGTAPPPPPPVANGAPTSPPAATRPAPAPAEHTFAPAPAERVFLLGISPSSRAVAVLLEQLPAARHVQVVSVPRLSELPESVQRGCAKLPLLVDAGRALELWDGHAIMAYLLARYAPPSSRRFHFPADPEGGAKVAQFLAYRQATLWPAVRDHVFAQLFPASPVCPVSRGPALREYVEHAEVRLQMELSRLSTVFLEETPFLAGEAPSAADLSCACAVSLLDWVSSPRVEQYPNVAVWLTAVARLPGFKESAAAHRQFAVTPNNVQQEHFALALIE